MSRNIVLAVIIGIFLCFNCASMIRAPQFAADPIETYWVYHNTDLVDAAVTNQVESCFKDENIRVEVVWLGNEEEIAKQLALGDKGHIFAFVSSLSANAPGLRNFVPRKRSADNKYVLLCN